MTLGSNFNDSMSHALDFVNILLLKVPAKHFQLNTRFPCSFLNKSPRCCSHLATLGIERVHYVRRALTPVGHGVLNILTGSEKLVFHPLERGIGRGVMQAFVEMNT